MVAKTNVTMDITSNPILSSTWYPESSTRSKFIHVAVTTFHWCAAVCLSSSWSTPTCTVQGTIAHHLRPTYVLHAAHSLKIDSSTSYIISVSKLDVCIHWRQSIDIEMAYGRMYMIRNCFQQPKKKICRKTSPHAFSVSEVCRSKNLHIIVSLKIHEQNAWSFIEPFLISTTQHSSYRHWMVPIANCADIPCICKNEINSLEFDSSLHFCFLVYIIYVFLL